MRIYISGKREKEVISDDTRKKFARAEEDLKKNGSEVFNPCNEEWQYKLKKGYESQFFFDRGKPHKALPLYAYALLEDIKILSFQDAIYMLAGYDKDAKARAEMAYAIALDKDVYFEQEEEAIAFLEHTWEYKISKISNIEKKRYVENCIFEAWKPLL